MLSSSPALWLRHRVPAHWHATSLFERQPKPSQCFSHGRWPNRHAVLSLDPLAQLRQRLLGCQCHLGQQRIFQRGQAQRDMAASVRPGGLGRAGFGALAIRRTCSHRSAQQLPEAAIPVRPGLDPVDLAHKLVLFAKT